MMTIKIFSRKYILMNKTCLHFSLPFEKKRFGFDLKRNRYDFGKKFKFISLNSFAILVCKMVGESNPL